MFGFAKFLVDHTDVQNNYRLYRNFDKLFGHKVDELVTDPYLAKLTKTPIPLERGEPGTFLYSYHSWADKNGISVPKTNEMHGLLKSWVLRRSLKLHDMLHVLLGMDTDPWSEMYVVAASYKMMDPVIGNAWRLGHLLSKDKDAYNLGLGVSVYEDLFRYRLEEHWGTPIEDLRRRLIK
jgi:ubiquinone biosynthesis protein Coq4